MLHTFAFKKSLVFFFSKAHLQHKTSILYQSEGGKRGLMSCLLRLTCLYEQQEIPTGQQQALECCHSSFFTAFEYWNYRREFLGKINWHTLQQVNSHTKVVKVQQHTSTPLYQVGHYYRKCVQLKQDSWSGLLPIDRSEQIIKNAFLFELHIF